MREAILELARWIRPALFFGADDGDGEGEGDGETSQEEAKSKAETKESKEEPETFSKEYVEKLRKEAAGHRVKNSETATALEVAEAKLKEIEQKDMDELEKAKADLKDALAAQTKAESEKTAAVADAASLKISTAVTLAAIEAGFNDPEDVLGMVSQDDLVDDDGEINKKAIKARIKSLGEKKPYLLKQAGSGSGDGAPTGKLGDKGTEEELIKAHHEKFLAGGRVARTG